MKKYFLATFLVFLTGQSITQAAPQEYKCFLEKRGVNKITKTLPLDGSPIEIDLAGWKFQARVDNLSSDNRLAVKVNKTDGTFFINGWALHLTYGQEFELGFGGPAAVTTGYNVGCSFTP
jgi:hypothetical protein